MRTWKVLVVDDERGWQEVISVALQTDPRFGVNGVADNGRTAIQWVQDHCPDAIVLDVQMPEMDGLEALPSLRRLCRESVIVMHSSDPHSAIDGVQRGADAIHDKAHSPFGLLDRLAELCAGRWSEG